MSGLTLLPLGVGDAFTALHYTTCLAVGAEGQWLMVDCPHPIRKMMREASATAGLGLDVGDITAMVLTHLHADHSSGVEDYAYYVYYVLKGRARLLAHPEVSARLWDGHLAGSMEEVRLPGAEPICRTLAEFIDLAALDDAAPVQLGPFAIECRRTIHAIPTYALRISAAGRTLGLSADTAFDPSLIDWLSAADLIVHEATIHESAHVHTPYDRLAALPGPLRAKMRLFHYPDAFDVDGSAIEPLRQGRLYEV
jgi:ribonuclease BN (tRNA processing enzyme)